MMAYGEVYGQEIRMAVTIKRSEVLRYAIMWRNLGNDAK